MLEIFQISMALLVSLTGLTAAIAEGAPQLAFTLPIALATWYFVDYQKIWSAPKWLTSTLALVALLVTGAEFAAMVDQSYLAAGNHLLSYLTWILLFQQKTVRTYWTLLALCISQIAITSLLTYSMWFGIALLAFSLLASWTLSIFLLYRSVNFLNDDRPTQKDLSHSSSTRNRIARHWSGVSRDRHERLVTGRFYGSTVAVTGVTLSIATLFFLFIPRIWPSKSMARGGTGRAPLTGFTTEVRLGDMGEILESNENVMTVQVFDARTGIPLAPLEAEKYLGAEPLFRGAVLEEYLHGRWHRSPLKASRDVDEGISDAEYRLRIDLEPLGTGAIFGFGNTLGAATAKPYGTISWDYFTNELTRGEETDLDRNFSYDLFTASGPPDQWLSERRRFELASPFKFDLRTGRLIPMNQTKFFANLNYLTELPRNLAPLFPIVEKITQGTSTKREAAQRVNDWLMNSGEFQYSMKLQRTNTSIDPILDFLTNHKTGHCEYFASSMATMLRCLRIPSRVVTGFKGGTFDPLTGTLQVRMLHAHAWVEAYIDDRWITFDPTPPERNATVSNINKGPSRWLRNWRTAEGVWHRLSLMSRDTQEERIYQPLVERLKTAGDTAKELMQGRRDSIRRVLTFFTSPERWFTMEGAIVAVLLMMLLAAVSWLIRGLYQATRTLSGFIKSSAGALGSRTPRVPFYDRFIALLKQHGFVQAPTQTAREFIHATIPAIESKLTQNGAKDWLEDVVEQFYRVRFGEEELTPEETQALEQRLRSLEACLASDQDEST